MLSAKYVSSDELISDDTKLVPMGLIPVIVLDLEMLGNTDDESQKENDAALLGKFSKVFREQIKSQTIFDVIDDEESLALMTHAAESQYLHRCNGCELDIGRKVGAELVVAPWVFRSSVTIQTFFIELREVETGNLVFKTPYTFYGNTEKAWTKIVLFAIQDLKREMKDNF